jgi:hypothetical protein
VQAAVKIRLPPRVTRALRHHAATALAALALIGSSPSARVGAQSNTTLAARAVLIENERITLTGDVDSNSPVVWDRVFGRWTLFVITSFSGQPSVSSGRSLTMLQRPNKVRFEEEGLAGVWMESVIRDTDGTWYGFYHHEQEVADCNAPSKVVPRIGAARSKNRGRTWDDLGPIIEAPRGSLTCNTHNHYFLGGVGDFTAILDRDSQFLYFFYTQYVERSAAVGVTVARMVWADRDDPSGKVTVWNNGAWLAAELEDDWEYPLASPMVAARDRWDNGNQTVDVFWGPAVHWNTHLNQYVMLLNRANDNEWRQEGIYFSYNARIDDPRAWTEPAQVFAGGRWYPQVIGLDPNAGTDKEAGEVARFYMSGVSDFLIRFLR